MEADGAAVLALTLLLKENVPACWVGFWFAPKVNMPVVLGALVVLFELLALPEPNTVEVALDVANGEA